MVTHSHPIMLMNWQDLLVKMDTLGAIKRREMGEKSKEIINEWGLDRFCQEHMMLFNLFLEVLPRTREWSPG